MLKKSRFLMILFAFICFHIVLNLTFVQAAFSEVDVDFKEINPPNGSIYFGEKDISYSLEIQNQESEAYEVSISYEIYNQNDEVVLKKESESFTLNANARVIKGFKIYNDFENGIYEIKVSLSGSFGVIEKNESFSVAAENNSLSDFSGFSTHFGKQFREHIDDSNSIISGGGFGWIRDEIYWSEVKTSSGYSVPEYAENYVNKVTSDGKKVLLILGFGHSDYDSGAFPTSDAAVEAYAEYCKFMAEHFKGKIDTFEIWNEPDLYTKADGSEVTGKDYAKLVIAAHNAITAVQPEATVVVGALTEAIGSEDFLREMLAVEGIEKCIDVLSVHPYANTGYYADENTYRPNRNILLNVNIVKKALDDAGLENIPVWITEYGTSSNSGSSGYTEEEQAINLVRASVLARTEPRVEKIFIYNLKEKGKDETALEDNFGVLEYSKMKAKPAFLALSYMNSVIGGAEFKSIEADTTILSRKLSKVSFENTNRDESIFVLWGNKTINSTAEINIVYDRDDTAAEAIDNTIYSYKNGTTRVFDLYGNEINITDGKFTVGEAPVYVVCRKSNLRIEENNGNIKVAGLYANPNEKITVVVKKENSVGKKLFYINQTTADEYGNFSFTFDINDGDIYKLYIYNGIAKSENGFGNENYEFDIDYFVGSEELTDIEQVKSGDTVKLAVTAKDLNGLFEELAAIAVIYKNNGTMENVNISKSVWDGDEAVMSAEVKVKNADDIGALKFMLWDEKLSPEFDAAVSEKGVE